MNRSVRRLLAVLLLAAALGPGSGADAAPAPADSDAPSQITSMDAQDGLNPVEARRLRFLFWGYTAIWILLAAYVVSISLRLRAVHRELEGLRARMGGGAR